MKHVWSPALFALLMPLAARGETLVALLEDHWTWTLQNAPVFATTIGVRDQDSSLGSQSVASIDMQAREAAEFARRARAIDPASLSADDRLNRDVLLRLLDDQVEGARFPQRLMLFTNRNGWHISFADLPEAMPFFTRADYVSYVARLEDYPRYNREGMETTRAALKAGAVQPCAPMKGFETSIAAHIVSTPEQSVFWKPFARRPAAIAEADWTALQDRARTAIRDQVVPAYAAFQAFYLKEVQPRCRSSLGATALPMGADYYAWRVRSETTTSQTPRQIHDTGLAEVARIRTEMEALLKRSGFAGSRAEYVAKLRNDPAQRAASPDALVEQTAALMKRVDGEMPRFFGTLPRLPYTVKAMQAEVAAGNTTAYYEPGAAQSGRPGIYRVNTTELEQRPLFELPALSLHEAVPGHHHQIALQQELELPMLRRHVAFFTAFVEGWGLYSERLGIEMGLYDTPEKDFGRLSYEMWRACRLVVDTGLHAFGWTREQAIDYMMANTALSRANIEAEVNRYITWPGQALAYKTGELKIRALRSEAEQRLGARFDLRRFHDAILTGGALPLSVLETRIREWISKEETRS
jgi:uncharacterized protein (DUF885 family)